MKNLKGNNGRFFLKTVAVPLLLFALMIMLLVFCIGYFSSVSGEQGLILTEQAIRRATVQCYANEGRYPSSIEYLEENYGVNVDHDTYRIVYMSQGANLMPDIAVFR